MLGLFSKKKETTTDQVDFRGRRMSDIIEEIHDTFYTEVDRLLEEANIAKSLDMDKQALIDKCHRLRALGFTQTQEVQEAEKEIERLGKAREENAEKQELIGAINYYSTAYPNYKFITEDSVNKICKKYGLFFGDINIYIGTVPDKNLRHIEEFKVKDSDKAVRVTPNLRSRLRRRRLIELPEDYFISKNKFDTMALNTGISIIVDAEKEYIPCPLQICAPQKDFNLTDAELKGFEILDIPDPVVLCPVVYNKKRYFLIVTAWGLEASDELVVNQKMN